MTRVTNGDVQSDLAVDVFTVPWSYRGSYMSFSTLAGDRGALTPNIDVCLVSHYKPYGAPCFVLRPEVVPLPEPSGFHTTPSPVTYRASPQKLDWLHDGEVVAEATFMDDRTVRLRGTIPMSFDTEMDKLRSYFYVPPKPAKESYDTVEWSSIGLMPLRFLALSGTLSTIGATTYKDGRITISPSHGSNGTWELLIHERDPGDTGHAGQTADQWAETVSHTPFSKSAQRMRAQFVEYARGMCPWAKGHVDHLDLLASYVMWTSTVRAAGFVTTEAVLMSKLWMNKVWSWDNCFNALSLAAHPDLLQGSIDNLLLPFTQQLPDGRIPDALMYNEITWDFTKPPIQGWTVDRLLELLPDITTDQLRVIYDKIGKFTDMWLVHRRVVGSELPFYAHGNDSGWDNSTSFDGQFVVVNADLASHLILQTDMLSRVASRLGLKQESQKWSSERERLVKALIEELWDGENFRVKDAWSGKTRKSTSLLQYIPLMAAEFLPKIVVDKMMSDIGRFLTPWGLATEPPESDKYDSDGYWRGPIWAPSTILLVSGVRAGGNTELANDLTRRFFKLCEKGGFAENYDAVTGEGRRDLSHTWSSSIYLVMRNEAHKLGL